MGFRSGFRLLTAAWFPVKGSFDLPVTDQLQIHNQSVRIICAGTASVQNGLQYQSSAPQTWRMVCDADGRFLANLRDHSEKSERGSNVRGKQGEQVVQNTHRIVLSQLQTSLPTSLELLCAP